MALILEAVDFVATVEENEWSRGRGESRDIFLIGQVKNCNSSLYICASRKRKIEIEKLVVDDL